MDIATLLGIFAGLGLVVLSILLGEGVAGFKPFPARPGVVVTDEEVNALREAEGI